jgi:hypothetical protein
MRKITLVVIELSHGGIILTVLAVLNVLTLFSIFSFKNSVKISYCLWNRELFVAEDIFSVQIE